MTLLAMNPEAVGEFASFVALFVLAPLALYGLMIPLCAAALVWFAIQDVGRWSHDLIGRPVPEWSIPHTGVYAERPSAHEVLWSLGVLAAIPIGLFLIVEWFVR